MSAPRMTSVVAGSCARPRAAFGLSLLLLAGCLDADDPELAGYSPNVLPQGTRIPSVEDDPLIAMRIANNAGVDELVTLHSAYAGGRAVRYWDFGVASMSLEPIWLFRKRGEDGMPQEVDHPDLIDTVPGDMGYSSFRSVYIAYATARWDGERITSAQALEDAIELGLIEQPEALGMAVNWPVVPAVTQLEIGEGDEPLEPSPVYYHGRVATQLKIGGMTPQVGLFPIERGSLAPGSAYVLRRQNEVEPLDEGAWQADLNADGDMQDSNVVFAADAGEAGYTSLWQQVDVIVPPDYDFGNSQSVEDLFTMQPWGLQAKNGAVVEYAPSEVLLNRPIRYVAP